MLASHCLKIPVSDLERIMGHPVHGRFKKLAIAAIASKLREIYRRARSRALKMPLGKCVQPGGDWKAIAKRFVELAIAKDREIEELFNYALTLQLRNLKIITPSHLRGDWVFDTIMNSDIDVEPGGGEYKTPGLDNPGFYCDDGVFWMYADRWWTPLLVDPFGKSEYPYERAVELNDGRSQPRVPADVARYVKRFESWK